MIQQPRRKIRKFNNETLNFKYNYVFFANLHNEEKSLHMKLLSIIILLFYFILFLKKFVLLFSYSCLHFLPIPPLHPSQTHLPPLPPPSPLILSIVVPCKLLSPLSPPHSPLAIVRLFLTSMSLVIFCLLFSSIYYVPVKGEIIWYLSLTAWLISLSIMLSSSIHACLLYTSDAADEDSSV